MSRTIGIFKIAAGSSACFWRESAAGTWHTRSVEAQNRFGQPKTVIHVVVYKWKNTASQDDKDQALNGIKTMAGKIPGMKNIWLKTQRNQIRDFDGVYAIEFASPEAAADYAESPEARSVAKALGRTSREQLVVPGVKSLALDRPMREAYRGSRTIPSLRRTRASTAPSDKIRLPHFTTVASGVTPYRGLGCGASIARRITRAQSSGVVFDFARESLTLAMNCA